MSDKNANSSTEVVLHEILRWQMLGKTIKEIAALMNCGERRITTATQSPRYKVLQSQYLDETYAPVDTAIKARRANVMLEEASADAAEALIELLNAKQQVLTAEGQLVEVDISPSDKRLTATAILDRAGFGPMQRKTVNKRVELDPMLAKLMYAALVESRVVDAEVVDARPEITGPTE